MHAKLIQYSCFSYINPQYCGPIRSRGAVVSFINLAGLRVDQSPCGLIRSRGTSYGLIRSRGTLFHVFYECPGLYPTYTKFKPQRINIINDSTITYTRLLF